MRKKVVPRPNKRGNSSVVLELRKWRFSKGWSPIQAKPESKFFCKQFLGQQALWIYFIYLGILFPWVENILINLVTDRSTDTVAQMFLLLLVIFINKIKIYINPPAVSSFILNYGDGRNIDVILFYWENINIMIVIQWIFVCNYFENNYIEMQLCKLSSWKVKHYSWFYYY